MNLKEKLAHIILNPWSISLIILLIVYFIIPIKIDKYNLKLIAKEDRGNDWIVYRDLDHDGNSEKIHLFEHFIGKVGIIVYSEGRILDQWNFNELFRGNMITGEGIAFQDTNRDGVEEILLATFYNGTILLHCFDPISGKVIFSDRKVGTYTLSNGDLNTSVLFAGGQDFNMDGYNEIYFALNSAFSVWPRGMNVYDYKHDSLLRSPKSCNIMIHIQHGDIDGDGIGEYFASSQSAGNCDPDDPYSDHYAWLMVLTPDMRFKFKPVQAGVYPAWLFVKPYQFGRQKYLAGLYTHHGKEESPCFLALFDQNGKLVKKKEFEFTAGWAAGAHLLPQSDPQRLYVINGGGTVFTYNPQLEVISTLEMGGIYNAGIHAIDADSDGNDEFLFLSKSRDKLLVTSTDFSDVTEIQLEESANLNSYSVILKTNTPPELFIQGDDFNYTFLYLKNPYYPFRFFIFPAIYLIVLAFIFLLSRLQRIRLEHKYTAEKELKELQLKSVKSQLDPHFTLNLIASIGDLFDKKDQKTTQYVFGKYSTLLRDSVLNADQYSVRLDQELDFVENYLKLEKFRLDDQFDFEITNAGNRNTQQVHVPKMLIHSFVENAVKHGIKDLCAGGSNAGKRGKIEITVSIDDHVCTISIKDNGIGREKSKKITKFSTGKGLSIIDRITTNYNELKKTRITYRINDLKDPGGEVLGTEVIVKVPIQSKG